MKLNINSDAIIMGSTLGLLPVGFVFYLGMVISDQLLQQPTILVPILLAVITYILGILILSKEEEVR